MPPGATIAPGGSWLNCSETVEHMCEMMMGGTGGWMMMAGMGLVWILVLVVLVLAIAALVKYLRK